MATAMSFVRSVQLPKRYWAYALLGTAVGGILLGIPTAIIPNPVFERMISAGPFDYLFWTLSSVLFGLVGATYLIGPDEGTAAESHVMGGSVLSVFAVGCPICNKIVVLALGMSGALTYFAPIQPLIGLVSVGLLGYALWLRLHAFTGVCPVRSS